MKKITILLLFNAAYLFAQTDSIITIEITSNYDNAHILVDDQETDLYTPAKIDLPVGQHKIALRWNDVINHAEYAAEELIEVSNRDTNKFLIEFKPVTVNIVCNSEYTKLYLNGRIKGEGNNLVIDHIIPGTYKLQLKQPFGITAEKSVYFPPNNNDCPTDCFVFGNLNVISEEISGTPIIMNGLETDKTIPATFNNLIIGEYTVSTKVDGKIISKKIIVKANEENYAHINPKQIEIENKQQDLILRKEQERIEKEKRFIAKEKERLLLETARVEDASKPKRQLLFKKGISGEIGTFIGSGVSGHIGGAIGVFISIPILNKFYIRDELKYFEKNIRSINSSGDNEYAGKYNAGYVYLSVVLNKEIFNDLYVLGGANLGVLVHSEKIPYGVEWDSNTNNLETLYAGAKKKDFSYVLGIGFDLPNEFFSEIRFARSLEKFAQAKTKLNTEIRAFTFSIGYSL